MLWHQQEGCCVPTVKNWTSPYKNTHAWHVYLVKSYWCIWINSPVLLWWRDGLTLQSQLVPPLPVTSEVRWQSDERCWHHAGGRGPRPDWFDLPAPTAVLHRCPALYSTRVVPPPGHHWLNFAVWARDWSERLPVSALRPGAACAEHREAIVAGVALRAGGGGGGGGGGCAARERRAPSRWSPTEWGDGEGGREEGVACGGAGAGPSRAEPPGPVPRGVPCTSRGPRPPRRSRGWAGLPRASLPRARPSGVGGGGGGAKPGAPSFISALPCPSPFPCRTAALPGRARCPTSAPRAVLAALGAGGEPRCAAPRHKPHEWRNSVSALARLDGCSVISRRTHCTADTRLNFSPPSPGRGAPSICFQRLFGS